MSDWAFAINSIFPENFQHPTESAHEISEKIIWFNCISSKKEESNTAFLFFVF